MNNIILIGMPGAGKSTIGVLLAKEIGYKFIDSDLLIQSREKRLLNEIIMEEGRQKFLEIEESVNSELDVDKTVIATGGSVIYSPNAMSHLKQIGTVIYLSLQFEILKNRLKDIKRRGVVLTKGQSLYDLYLERCPLYEKYADITIETQNCSIEQTLDKTIEKLKI